MWTIIRVADVREESRLTGISRVDKLIERILSVSPLLSSSYNFPVSSLSLEVILLYRFRFLRESITDFSSLLGRNQIIPVDYLRCLKMGRVSLPMLLPSNCFTRFSTATLIDQWSALPCAALSRRMHCRTKLIVLVVVSDTCQAAETERFVRFFIRGV